MISPRPPLNLINLLSFRDRRALALLALGVGLVLAGFGVYSVGMPVWGGTLVALGVLAAPVGLKWGDDIRMLGTAAGLLSALVMLQAFHFSEHAIQMVQFYLLNRPAVLSQGLISSLNIEWVHFIWNVVVLVLTIYLFRAGMQGFFGWALLIWTTAHTLEHTYLLVRYLQVGAELKALGLSGFQVSQALPGILGRDGLLAENGLCGSIPGLTTLPRVAIHFIWNLGETVLLLGAAHFGLSRLIQEGKKVKGA
jgi:hypothetical protein